MMSRDLGNQQPAPVNSAFYDERWRTKTGDSHPADLMRADFIVNGIRQYLPRGDCEILDLGCGRGWMASLLSPFGRVTGVDFSEIGIQFAKDNYGDHGEFVLADRASETLGLPEDRKFDVLVCTEVIEHVEDQPRFLRQIKGFLKPKGWLFLTAPNGNVWQEFSKHRLAVHWLQPVENWVAPSRLSQMLRCEGFTIKMHEGRPWYGLRLGRHRCLQRRLFHRLFTLMGYEHQYGRFILMDALYQFVIAQAPA